MSIQRRALIGQAMAYIPEGTIRRTANEELERQAKSISAKEQEKKANGVGSPYGDAQTGLYNVISNLEELVNFLEKKLEPVIDQRSAIADGKVDFLDQDRPSASLVIEQAWAHTAKIRQIHDRIETLITRMEI